MLNELDTLTERKILAIFRDQEEDDIPRRHLLVREAAGINAVQPVMLYVDTGTGSVWRRFKVHQYLCPQPHAKQTITRHSFILGYGSPYRRITIDPATPWAAVKLTVAGGLRECTLAKLADYQVSFEGGEMLIELRPAWIEPHFLTVLTSYRSLISEAPKQSDKESYLRRLDGSLAHYVGPAALKRNTQPRYYQDLCYRIPLELVTDLWNWSAWCRKLFSSDAERPPTEAEVSALATMAVSLIDAFRAAVLVGKAVPLQQ